MLPRERRTMASVPGPDVQRRCKRANWSSSRYTPSKAKRGGGRGNSKQSGNPSGRRVSSAADARIRIRKALNPARKATLLFERQRRGGTRGREHAVGLDGAWTGREAHKVLHPGPWAAQCSVVQSSCEKERGVQQPPALPARLAPVLPGAPLRARASPANITIAGHHMRLGEVAQNRFVCRRRGVAQAGIVPLRERNEKRELQRKRCTGFGRQSRLN